MGGRGYQFILLRHNTRTMKTAMQELIEELQSINDFKYKGLVIELVKNKLEKEKEQIRNAYNDGYFAAYKYKDWEEYYNQPYNQNK
jgi:hypothetical protein